MKPTVTICIPTARHPSNVEYILGKISKESPSVLDEIEICVSATGNNIKSISVPERLSEITLAKFAPELVPAHFNLLSVLEMATGRFVLIIGDQYPLIEGSIQSLILELQRHLIPMGGFLRYAGDNAAGGKATLEQAFLRAGMLSGIILPNDGDFGRQLRRIVETYPATIYPQIPLVVSLAEKYDFRFFESSRVEPPDRSGSNPFRSLANRPKDYGLQERLFWLANMSSKFSKSQIAKIEISLGIWIGGVVRANLRMWPGDSLAMLLSNLTLGAKRPLTAIGIYFGLLFSKRLQLGTLRHFRISWARRVK